MATGITKRHSTGSPGRDGGRCNCNAGWEASVWSQRDGKKIRKTFPTASAAKSWRADAVTALERGSLRVPKPTTVREAWEAWYESAEAGTVRTRSGDPFKPSTLRSYGQGMALRVLPTLGAVRLADLRRPDIQAFADGLLADGLSATTISGTIMPLRAIFRHAVERGELAVSPCDGVRLPAVRDRRDRIADPTEAAALLAAVPDEDRAIWATAVYGGLRLGELQALRVESIDLAVGVLHVERGWDAREGEIELKSRAGRRRVPIPAALRDHLLDHLAWTDRTGAQLAFGRSAADPFDPSTIQARADRAWRAAGLERITPHACRHTFASLMIAAGVNAKALSTFMGHASIAITLDRYGHLMPGSETEAAELLDNYLAAQRERVEERARAAHQELTGAQNAHESQKPLEQAINPASLKVLAIFGPTAVGKTGVAIAVAGLLRERGENPVAVSCDALQVYRGLEVLTGAPTEAEQALLEHRLVGIIGVDEEFSAGRFSDLARGEIDGLLAAARRPIVVGGTGLYMRAALSDMELRPPVRVELREQVEREIAERGPEALHAELDPEVARDVHASDRKRVARLAELQRAGFEPPPPDGGELWTAQLRHPTLLVGLVVDRDDLARRIDTRVDELVDWGAADEARAVEAAGASRTARAALGFEQLLSSDVDGMKRAHRAYARRQLTWMRKMPGVTLVDRTDRADSEVAEEVVAELDT